MEPQDQSAAHLMRCLVWRRICCLSTKRQGLCAIASMKLEITSRSGRPLLPDGIIVPDEVKIQGHQLSLSGAVLQVASAAWVHPLPGLIKARQGARRRRWTTSRVGLQS